MLQIGPRQRDGILNLILLSHQGSDGRGVTATGAVTVTRGQARSTQPEAAGTITEIIEASLALPAQVPPLDQHGANAARQQLLHRRDERGRRGGCNASQPVQLIAIGCQQIEVGKEPLDARQQIIIRHGVPSAGDGHGIVDDKGSLGGCCA